MTRFIPGGPPRYAHQKRGLMHLVRNRGVGALLYDPGLGKTGTALDYASLLALKVPGGEARVLVVCPLAAIDTWVLQSEEFISPQVDYWAEALGGTIRQRAEALAARGGSRNVKPAQGRLRKGTAARALHTHRSVAWSAQRRDGQAVEQSAGPDALRRPRLVLAVVNLDTFSSRQAVGSRTMADVLLDAVQGFDPHLVIVDEMHKIKGASSNVSRLLGRIGERVPRRIGLTGTVMPHGPLDVFGQWRFIDPTAFGPKGADGVRRKATYQGFKRRFAVLGGYMGREVTGYRNLDDLQRIMAQRATVARKEDALDLPPTTDVVVPVNLSSAEARTYARMKDDLAVQFAGSTASAIAPNRLSQMMRLRQITAGHLPDDQGNVRTVGSSKVDTVRSIVNDTLVGEKRVVVFALFRHEIEALRTALSSDDGEVLVITGSTPARERTAIRKRFGSDESTRLVLVAQISTLNLAVNELVTASHAVFVSLSQKRDELEQAKARLDRTGQTRPVTFWFTLAPGTIDQVIYRSHQQRTDLETAVLNHITNQSTEDQ